jgi:hypothetical protein
MDGHQVFIGVGSNRGDKKKIVKRRCNDWLKGRETVLSSDPPGI